ncbi:MAG: hypothetical protein R3D65_12195 [Zhengella sp.]|uniref:hypothetical protein n=1 Tax=Zhengella sp. TaxID=2282762 RepID=UPI001D3BFD86|nr:hypothetical protein [Notoacmeibacter sp.]MCC0027365.1 hypothetical protein [Brucellaceae bacterium]
MIYTLFPDLNDRAPQRRNIFVRHLFRLDKAFNMLFSKDVQILFRTIRIDMEPFRACCLRASGRPPSTGGPIGDSPDAASPAGKCGVAA